MTLKREYDDEWQRGYVNKATGERYAGLTIILNVVS